jgi:hypothetical protein
LLSTKVRKKEKTTDMENKERENIESERETSTWKRDMA